MKKALLSIFTLIAIQSIIAADNLLIYSNGVVLYKNDISKIDSIVFEVADTCKPSVSEVVIGAQTWTTTNLNVDKFRNGDIIPEAKNEAEWNAAGGGTPVWCYYLYSVDSGAKYGKLYNWHAVNDSRGLAPAGWHVPSNAEWTVLTTYLGGEDVAATKMKNTCGWTSESWNKGTNTSGFSGLPGGSLIGGGSIFQNIGEQSFHWSSSQASNGNAWFRALNSANPKAYTSEGGWNVGMSVRCVKD